MISATTLEETPDIWDRSDAHRKSAMARWKRSRILGILEVHLPAEGIWPCWNTSVRLSRRSIHCSFKFESLYDKNENFSLWLVIADAVNC